MSSSSTSISSAQPLEPIHSTPSATPLPLLPLLPSLSLHQPPPLESVQRSVDHDDTNSSTGDAQDAMNNCYLSEDDDDYEYLDHDTLRSRSRSASPQARAESPLREPPPLRPRSPPRMAMSGSFEDVLGQAAAADGSNVQAAAAQEEKQLDVIYRPKQLVRFGYEGEEDIPDDSTKYFCIFCWLDTTLLGSKFAKPLAALYSILLTQLSNGVGVQFALDMVFSQYMKKDGLFERLCKYKPFKAEYEKHGFRHRKATTGHHFLWSPNGHPHVTKKDIQNIVNDMFLTASKHQLMSLSWEETIPVPGRPAQQRCNEKNLKLCVDLCKAIVELDSKISKSNGGAKS